MIGFQNMIANAEFDHILLKCSLFSLLHIEPKKESRVWHPYGDFRRLKVFAVPVISIIMILQSDYKGQGFLQDQ